MSSSIRKAWLNSMRPRPRSSNWSMGQRDAAAIIAILNERFPEAGGVDDDVVEFLQIAYQQKWIIFREPE